MAEQVCLECGPNWNGMYNTDHRCVTCGTPTVAQDDITPRLKVARFGRHNLPDPRPQSGGAAALDIRITEAVTLYPGEEKLIGTGFAYEPPQGHALLLLPRSGLGAKHGVVLGNLIGLIDPDYRGELKAALWYRRSEGPPLTLERGERVAQLMCVPFLSLAGITHVNYDDLGRTERGDGGFGSSGRN